MVSQTGATTADLDTPIIVVDIAAVERNISQLFDRMQKFGGVSVRPHLKTGKCAEIARMLIAGGAQGICVAKLSEAEVFTDAGIEDILITTEIVGRTKLARLLNLHARNPKLRIVVDNLAVARDLNALPREMNSATEPIQVLIDLNVGQNRTGVDSGEVALSVARGVAELPHLKLIGVQGYEGHLQHLADLERQEKCRAAMAKLSEAVKLLRCNGFSVPVVTTGGTGTAEICAGCEDITEVQPGSFIFMDVAYRNATNGKYSNALSVLATVISKPAPDRAVVDAGLKCLSVDMGFAEPKNMPNLTYRPAGDEHGIVEHKTAGGYVPLNVGDKIELLPGHIDTTVALFDQYHIMRGGMLEAVWTIAARGKVQ